MCSLGTLGRQFFSIIHFVRTKNIVGSRVRQARKQAGVTQMDLAARLQLLSITIDRSGVAKLESGRRPASDVEVAAISKILNVPILWLFEAADEFFRRPEDR